MIDGHRLGDCQPEAGTRAAGSVAAPKEAIEGMLTELGVLLGALVGHDDGYILAPVA
jgi:hypothetical protein